MRSLAYGHHRDRAPTHSYEPHARGGDGGVAKGLATGELRRQLASREG